MALDFRYMLEFSYSRQMFIFSSFIYLFLHIFFRRFTELASLSFSVWLPFCFSWDRFELCCVGLGWVGLGWLRLSSMSASWKTVQAILSSI